MYSLLHPSSYQRKNFKYCTSSPNYFTKTYTYFGVQLDQTLSLRSHLEGVFKKATGRLYLLKRVRPQITTEAAMTIYTTMLVQLFTYCSILNGKPTRTYDSKIKNMEDRACRIIHNKKRDQKRASKL